MNLSPLPIQKFFDNRGRPLVGGRLFTYEAGTSTPVNTYTDSSGLVLNTNPVTLDYRGECRLWLDPRQAYKFTLAPPGIDIPPTNPIWTVDNITVAPANSDNAANDTGSVNNISVLIPQISSPVAFTRVVFKAANTNTGPTTLQVNGGTARPITWQNIGAFSGGEIQAGGIYEVIYDGAQWQLQGPTLFPWQMRSQAEILAGITPTNWSEPWNWVTRYGAKGDRVTDDLAAFNRAALVAVYSKEIYIPPVRQAGLYYRLSSAWVLQDLDGVHVYGTGIPSLLVIANAAGANCITLNSTTHCTIENIGIYGTSGCGNGIDLTNSSDNNDFTNIWIGWVDASGVRVTQGQSNGFNQIVVDDNNGFRPAALIGGLTDGDPNHGFYVLSSVLGLNNNNSFVNCRANAVGSVAGLQVGDGGGVQVASFAWFGGLIQGASNHVQFYLHTLDSCIRGAHIEPPVGVSANWVGTFDACTNTVVADCGVQGDVRLIGSCLNSGFENVNGYGMDIGVGTSRCYWRGGTYKNNSNGPAGGNIIDRAETSIIENLISAANVRVAQGGGLRPESQTVYLATNVEDWVLVAGTPTVPCGFVIFGTPTITRTNLPRTGSYRVQVVCSSSLDEGFSVTLSPSNQFVGKRLTVEAWVFNQGTPGLAYIAMLEGGTGVQVSQQSFTVGQWERMIVTFYPDPTATSVTIRFTGDIGTMFWDYISITSEVLSQSNINDLDPAVANPTISFGGRQQKILTVAASATNVTSFTNPHVGQPFTLMFTGNRTIVHGAPIFLAGAVNFAGTINDTLTLVYGSDGNFKEIGRAVI